MFTMAILILQNQPDCLFPEFPGVSCRGVHRSSLSRSGASGLTGAVHAQQNGVFSE